MSHYYFSMGTLITIEDALLYLDSTRILLSYRDIQKIGSILKPIIKIMRNFFSLQRTTNMAEIHLKNSLTPIWIVLFIYKSHTTYCIQSIFF